MKLVGVNVAEDKKFYREYSPISTLSVVLGTLSMFIENDLRYDERISLKEDYDMLIQQCNKYRGVLRLNQYYYEVDHYEKMGGCGMYRSNEEEEKQFKLLQKKRGKKIVQEDKKSSEKRGILDYNPIIRIPIK